LLPAEIDTVLYTTILFIHAVAVLILTASIAIEAWMLFQMRRTPSIAELRRAMTPVSGLTMASVSSLVVVYLTGAYLTERLAAWGFAWPRFAVLEVVLFGVLGAFTGHRLRVMRKLFTKTGSEAELATRARSSLLKVSLGIRIWVVIGTTLLTAAKTGFSESLSVVAASLLFGALTALAPWGARAANSAFVAKAR
jgi:hypothetical protein